MVCTLAVGASDRLTAADADIAARFVLLPSADRASVVVELDEEAQYTSIRTSDDRTLTVEVGPVKSRVVNQLLQAAAASPLVSQVRVRGITRGSEGTLISLQIVGKSSISGSVRRVQRRIYIDLEPLSTAAAAIERPSIESRNRRTAVAEPAKSNAPTSPRPAQPPAAPPPEEPTTRKPARTASAPPQVARNTVPEVRAVAPSTVAPTTASASHEPSSAAISKAEALALVHDVKSLERLKAETLAAKPSDADEATRAASDAVVVRMDALLTEARKKQLLADARLFRGAAAAPSSAAPVTTPPRPATPQPALPEETSPAGVSAQEPPSATVPSVSASGASAPRPAEQAAAGGFQQAMRQLRPELEQVNGTISVLTPGAVLSGDVPVQIESVLSRLRALEPPGELGSSHERACGALSTLLTGWVRAPNGQWVIAVGGDPTALEDTRAAMFDYLRAFDRFDRQSSPMTMSRTPGR